MEFVSVAQVATINKLRGGKMEKEKQWKSSVTINRTSQNKIGAWVGVELENGSNDETVAMLDDLMEKVQVRVAEYEATNAV